MRNGLAWCLVLIAPGCGGVSEARVSALEAQVAELKDGATDGGQTAALTDRVTALETANAESLQKMEQVLQTVQGELARMSSAAPAGAGTPTTAPAAGGDVWYAVEAALGTDAAGVTADGDTYTVKRAWLAAQVQALAGSGKAPKLTANKKGGVAVKGIKPKSLLELLGLKNNDVVTTIGETSVSQPADIVTGLKSAAGGTVVKVMRKKDEIVLMYKLID